MKFAVVFPGQGSQSVGMLSELASEYAQIGDTFDEAADVLGTDYWALSQTGTDADLADTRVTQPLMFISGIAVWRVLQSLDIPAPAVIAGHSLGEFSALVASGALAFKDGLQLVARRAELMSQAVPDGEGGMAALIGMSDEDVIAVCNEITGTRISEAVNFNAPGQVAISGHVDALQKTVELASERGARKAIMLAVSVPNHSSLMREAGANLAQTIDSLTWSMPSVPLVQNAQASVPSDLDALLTSLRAHVFSPVQWTRSVETMRDQYNTEAVIEVGPGKVLSGLGRRIDKALPTMPTESKASLDKVLQSISVSA
jgi:[acyl-carrier-protein] S-malonyltransferase